MALVRAAGEPSQVQVEAAARVERALAALRPDADEIEHGFEDLRGGLRVLQRALRTCSATGSTGRCRCGTCGCCWTARSRCCPPPRSGCSACWPWPPGTAPRTGTRRSRRHRCRGPGRGLAELVRRRLRCQLPEQRLLAAHDDLTYLVGDFAHAAAHGADPARLEELYAAALLESAHAAAGRSGWPGRPGATTR